MRRREHLCLFVKGSEKPTAWSPRLPIPKYLMQPCQGCTQRPLWLLLLQEKVHTPWHGSQGPEAFIPDVP